MSNTPDDRKYADSHEWALLEADGNIRVGITDHAQELLGDLVFVELPEAGQAVGKGDECSVVESVKAASDIYSPVTGEIVAVNDALEDSPEAINESPYDEGWIFVVKPTDASELDDLLAAEGYENLIDDE
ncbi:MAG: glycine cleavage system H protein [Cycloclasticus pugetii]|jgi:glycine cleavage system H protein|uniref:Glycine cleavage system H protein n=2 Tax=Cycloclasticus TaxID=34067 RepID=S5TUX4_9GAMM|nr:MULTISPECIES: glycine cleavage system protein GcvH [Cycloclasticus]AGS38823.1 Glycine cleavage system H protein (lipoate-binding) [Cycloclasticus zancles 78-ME]ATI02474.1 glycine cleavage system protein GcvH [Cycloclasticus sp. PY97N]EPD12938.1 glycine cleavage system protein H [Cycloclasticus pugetii]MBV1898575.1 glycine cleavage system protein GcvH [Cycloclasticus sp.]MDF1829208.1 glycine cleavage system protein GcvH [Cycloclasticus pugetii]